MIRPRPMVHAAVQYALRSGAMPLQDIYGTCREVLGVSEEEMLVERPDGGLVFPHEVRCSLATMKLENLVQDYMFSTWGLTPAGG